MSDDLIAFARAMDRSWLEGRFDDLAAFLAEDVVIAAPDGHTLISGLAEAVETYRRFMASGRVLRFDASDHVATGWGDTAVVTYAWDMAFETGGVTHEAKGREILVLARRSAAWRVVWRMQQES